MKARQNQSTAVLILHNGLIHNLCCKFPAPQVLDGAGEKLQTHANVLDIKKLVPISRLKERADAASALSR